MSERDREGGDRDSERSGFESALASARAELDELVGGEVGERRSILAAQRALLDDPMILDAARDRLAAGLAATSAWSATIRDICEQFESIEDERWRSRADEVGDVGERVMRLLAGKDGGPADPRVLGCVVVGQTLLASQVLALARAGAVGLALAAGSRSSHAAIMAKSLGLPTAVALGDDLLSIEPGASLTVDGDAGVVSIGCVETVVDTMPVGGSAGGGGVSSGEDGPLLMANVNVLQDAQRADHFGAQGAGLVRTEMLFAGLDAPPSELEQTSAYLDLLQTLRGQRVVLRTFDAAPDKPLWGRIATARGITESLREPEMFSAQLQAILRAAALAASGGEAQLGILLPNVATVEEVRAARGLLDETVEGLARQGLPVAVPSLGAMIEVPSALLMVEALAAEVEFLSVGSNDLASHLFATHREFDDHDALDPMQPALLRALSAVVEAGHAAGIPVSICGEIASLQAMAPILLGLGFDALSVEPRTIPRLSDALRRLSASEAESLLRHALECVTLAQVRALYSSP
jgi:phosphoenolpyruvate-protein kinase (PTS system EI component)